MVETQYLGFKYNISTLETRYLWNEYKTSLAVVKTECIKSKITVISVWYDLYRHRLFIKIT